jgi:hypothetical protein
VLVHAGVLKRADLALEHRCLLYLLYLANYGFIRLEQLLKKAWTND